VLARSINTSLVAILPILSILLIGAQLLGATTLQDFGLALFIGLTSGAYSSLFIASPLLAMLKEREVPYRRLRERLAASGKLNQGLTPAAAALGNRGASPLARSGGRTVAGGPALLLTPTGERRPAAAGVQTAEQPSGAEAAKPLTRRPATSRRAGPPARKKGGSRRR
jgi:preprotein translocase subunit SecF